MSSINELIEHNRTECMKHVRLPARQLGDWMQLTWELSANSSTATKPSYQTQNVDVHLVIEQIKLSTVTITT